MNKIKGFLRLLFPAHNAELKTEVDSNDVFFVNDDLSISLNHNSDTVKNAFKRNISRLKEIKS